MLITKFPAETEVKNKGVDLSADQFGIDLNNISADCVLIVNEQGLIQSVNPSFEGMFGYEKNDIYGESIKLLIPHIKKNTIPLHENENQESLKLDVDLKGVRKDGFKFPLNLSLNHFNSGIQRMTMIHITNLLLKNQLENEQQKINNELEQQIEEGRKIVSDSQYLFKIIATNFPNGIISVLDRDFNYVYLKGDSNNAEISRELKDGNSFLNRVNPDKRIDIKRKLLTTFNGENSSFEVTIDNKTFLVNAVGLRISNERINRILLVTQDITHLKKTEMDILDSLEKEKHLNEMKSQFVSMASHEFRSPLTTMLNSTTILSKLIDNEGSEQGVQKQVDRIKSTIQQLNNILNDFLSLGRLDEGKLDLNVSEVNLKECTSQIIEEMRDSTKPGQKLEYKHKGEEMALLDCNMLKNVYHNLISNAIKYSSENDTIRIETTIKDGQLKLIVQDEGIGIPNEEQKHIFERFFRAENTSNIKGTGLGLNIVKKYVESVGGNIKFFSIPNKGTTFIVDLPSPDSSVDFLNLN